MLEFYTYMYIHKKFQEAYINVSMKVYMIHTCTCMLMLSTNLVRPPGAAVGEGTRMAAPAGQSGKSAIGQG